MNRYEEIYEFRIATIEDVDKVMKFIRENWRENHILGCNKEFFLYEHGNGKLINFMICEDKISKEMIGMHGFIPYSKNSELLHVCGVMTMVRKDVTVPMLGVELIKQFIKQTQYKTYCGIGTNPKTMIPLVKRIFHRHTGKMEHYYLLNRKVNEFRVAEIKSKRQQIILAKENDEKTLIEFRTFAEVKERFEFNQVYENLPYKEEWYIKRRYFEHPIYKYRVFGIKLKEDIIALLVAREVRSQGAKVIRFIDFVGEVKYIETVGRDIQLLVEEEGYEYADFILAGVAEEVMNSVGFIRKNLEDDNIIPNYFEPFIKSNVEICFETSDEHMVIFRGDADADRPN